MGFVKYADKLKDPRWKDVREETLALRGRECMVCGRDDVTLNVHHTVEDYSIEPWEHPIWTLVVLCWDCHNNEHDDLRLGSREIVSGLQWAGFYGYDMEHLAYGFKHMSPRVLRPSDPPFGECLASTLGYALHCFPGALLNFIDTVQRRMERVRIASEWCATSPATITR